MNFLSCLNRGGDGSLIWILVLLLIFGAGCDNHSCTDNCGCGDSNSSIIWILLAALLLFNQDDGCCDECRSC